MFENRARGTLLGHVTPSAITNSEMLPGEPCFRKKINELIATWRAERLERRVEAHLHRP